MNKVLNATFTRVSLMEQHKSLLCQISALAARRPDHSVGTGAREAPPRPAEKRVLLSGRRVALGPLLHAARRRDDRRATVTQTGVCDRHFLKNKVSLSRQGKE